jgi:hypothetical protein
VAVGVLVNSKKLTERIIKDIEEAKSQGATTINCDKLIGYLNETKYEPELSSAEMERYKAELQKWIEDHKHAHDERKEMFKSVISYGQGAIKSLFLLNAGAVVVMLTFVTQLAKSGEGKVTEFVTSIRWFAIGVLAAAVVAALAYVSQLLYNYQKPFLTKIGIVFHVLCLIVACCSLSFFWKGLTLTLIAFEAYK